MMKSAINVCFFDAFGHFCHDEEVFNGLFFKKQADFYK